jgi:signal transduction histidine kinase
VDALQRTTRLYIGTLLGLAVGALALAVLRMTPVEDDEALLTGGLTGAMVLAWLFPIPIAAKTKFYVDTAVIVAAALLLQPALALVAAGSGTLLAHTLRRVNRDWAQALFNTAQMTLVAVTATMVLAAGGWDPHRGAAPDIAILPVVIVAAASIYPVSILLVSIVTALETSLPIIARFGTDLTTEPRAELVAHTALATVGFLAALIASVGPWALILLAVPIAAIYATLQQQHRVRLDAERARMMSDEALVQAQRLARVGSWEWLPVSDRWSWSDEGARLMAVDLNGHLPSSHLVLDAVHPDDRSQVAAALHHARHEPGAFTVGHRVVVAGADQERIVHHHAEIQSAPNGPLRYLGTVHDVTERVRAEAAMRQAKETAEDVSRTKSNLLSMVSHDLRTPLTAIQGYLEVVLGGSLGDVPEEQREFLEIAYRNTQNLTQMVRDLLDLARIEAGRFPLQRRAVDVSMALDEVVELLDPRAVMKGLQLDAVVAAGCPMIDADPARLHQLLLNVVDNAIKFTDDGAVYITAAQDGDDVVITVTDTGRGIASTDLPHIFEAFRQVGETARRARGSGLGLAIVQQLVTLHGGTISAASTLGEGTSVSLRLPTVVCHHEHRCDVPSDGRARLPRERKGAAL